MKNNWMANLIASALTLSTVACMQESPVSDPSAGGKANDLSIAARQPIGSTQAITLISTLAQLRAMSTSGNYRLANNIDASSTSSTPFVPVGFTKDPFHGTFDGNGFTITNLTVRGTGDNIGMFSWVANAKLLRVRLVNVNVVGGRNTGGIAGLAQNTDLNDSYVTGTVTGNVNSDSRLGMAFGAVNDFVRVNRCYATGTVNGWGRSVGGFIGYAYATGIQDPNDEFRLTVNEVFTNVNVNPNNPGNGSVYAGGLIGYLAGGVIQDINVAGSVVGRNAAGGILGFVANDAPNSLSSSLRGAVSRGLVTDYAVAGRAGTIGMSTGQFGWCGSFYDKTTDTGVLNPNMPEPACQVGKTSSELKNARTSPDRVITPYIYGQYIDQAFINQYGISQCYFGSGSDGDWGFGTCGATPVIWAANTSSEYNTLLRIPNPSVQPK